MQGLTTVKVNTIIRSPNHNCMLPSKPVSIIYMLNVDVGSLYSLYCIVELLSLNAKPLCLCPILIHMCTNYDPVPN